VSAAPALLSIHDVMPETLPAVASLREEILRAGLRAPALLVVPGRSWKPEDLETLRQWALAGSELIGHGWLHHTCPRSLKHRLHALLLSRNVAEHLALSPGGISDLMQRCADWFTAQNLPRPSAYVPPAWALGMSPRALAGLPFEQVETLRGVHVLSAGRRGFMPMPLLGFEADTVLRAAVLRRWNTPPVGPRPAAESTTAHRSASARWHPAAGRSVEGVSLHGLALSALRGSGRPPGQVVLPIPRLYN
jgi:predicted deacetylase